MPGFRLLTVTEWLITNFLSASVQQQRPSGSQNITWLVAASSVTQMMIALLSVIFVTMMLLMIGGVVSFPVLLSDSEERNGIDDSISILEINPLISSIGP